MKTKNKLLHFGLSLLTAAAALLSVTSSVQAADKKPNILVIFGDDIGMWNVSAYNMGMMGYRTPNIDSLAKQGTRLATEAKISALDGQISALGTGVTVDLASARNRVRQNQLQVGIDSADLVAIRRNYQIAIDRLERYEKGYRDGLFSLTDLETRRISLQQDYAKVIMQENMSNLLQ